uniref:DUF569 domain-containing protein n=1 Tax=Arundo donax TaxID=35708 RepID=A0A0A9HEP4_ARUDO
MAACSAAASACSAGASEPMVEQQRIIRCFQADDLGNFDPNDWAMFQFYGRSVFNLRAKVACHRGGVDDITLSLCVRAGFYGRLTPLVIDLPDSEEDMDIVVLTTGSPAAAELRHPNVDAP